MESKIDKSKFHNIETETLIRTISKRIIAEKQKIDGVKIVPTIIREIKKQTFTIKTVVARKDHQ
jgi:hypothetical protein